jgi:hypothetical protein
MIVLFTAYHGDGDARAYFERKWAAVPGIDSVAAYELSLQALADAGAGSDAWTWQGEQALPKHDARHRAVALRIAEAAMPLLEGERLLEEDRFDVAGADMRGIAQGRLCLRRRTTHSEAVYAYSCTRVVDGLLYRGLAEDPGDETVLSTLAGPAPETLPPLPETPQAAELGLMATIASTILLGVLSSLSGRVGMRAIDVAFETLGIRNPLEAADDSYEKLIGALRMQSRADFRRQIALRLRAFERLREDYRGGMRTKEKLDMIYHEIRQLTSWIEVDERSPDRVQLLAFAQSVYLSVMQEMAEWHRKDNPQMMKEFYAAMTARAAAEANVLTRVQNEAYEQRLAKITGLHDSFDFTFQASRIISYDDTVWRESGHDRPLEDQWQRAYYNCLERSAVTNACTRWEYTEKGRKAIANMEGILARHRQRIRSDLDKALTGIPQTIANFQKIAQMQIPPPPPK